MMDDKFKIDKGIPVPSPRRTGRKKKYPWDDLEIGDSFFVPGEESRKISSAKISSAAQSRKKSYGGKYAVREVTETGVKGVRVWRIE